MSSTQSRSLQHFDLLMYQNGGWVKVQIWTVRTCQETCSVSWSQHVPRMIHILRDSTHKVSSAPRTRSCFSLQTSSLSILSALSIIRAYCSIAIIVCLSCRLSINPRSRMSSIATRKLTGYWYHNIMLYTWHGFPFMYVTAERPDKRMQFHTSFSPLYISKLTDTASASGVKTP